MIESRETCDVVLATQRYSTSVLDRETVVCFLKDLHIGLAPKKTQ